MVPVPDSPFTIHHSLLTIRLTTGSGDLRFRRRFTLIELLVVIAIIAVLAAMLLPALTRAKETGRRAVCLSQLRQINLAALSFVDDHDGYLPIRSEHPGMWFTGAGWGSGEFALYGLDRSQWLVSSLWPTNNYGEPGGGYITDKVMMRCPSRFDHYQTSNPWDMVVAKQLWNSFWSSYHASGISGFLWHAGHYSSVFPLYLVRAEKQQSDQALFTDFMGRDSMAYEYGGDWWQLHQTNHWVGIPAGGNVVNVDGSGNWLQFTKTNWSWQMGCGNSPAGSWAVWGSLWGGPTADMTKYYYSGSTNPTRGKLFMPSGT